MPGLLKKLLNLSIWNTSAAGLNFLSNLVIAKAMGVAIFGKLFYISSLVGIFSLILILVPPNYSVIKYQDDDKYRYILSAFYIQVWILLILPVIIFHHLVDIPVWLFYLFAFTTSLQSYFDITFQAENKLNRYYSMLFLQALVKIAFIITIYFFGYLNDLSDLVLVISLSQVLVSGVFLVLVGNIFLRSVYYFKSVYFLIWSKRKLFTSYYFNIGLKKISTNLIVLLFEPFITQDILGVYALFMKIYQFVFGLVRTIESIFLFKNNLTKLSGNFLKKGLLIGLVLQLGHIVIGMIYLKYIDGNFYFNYLLLMSFVFYLYVFYLKARAVFLTQYKNEPINISYLFFLIPVASMYTIKLIGSNRTTLFEIILLFTLSSVLQMSYLIFAEKKLNHEKAY